MDSLQLQSRSDEVTLAEGGILVRTGRSGNRHTSRESGMGSRDRDGAARKGRPSVLATTRSQEEAGTGSHGAQRETAMLPP